MERVKYNHNIAKTKRKNDGKPLSNDISGIYLFDEHKAQLTKTTRKQPNIKNIFSIRLNTRQYNTNYIWFNHSDYTVIRSEYMNTDEGIEFIYNDQKYLIPHQTLYDEVNKYFKRITKMS